MSDLATFMPSDSCCDKRLSKALRTGELDEKTEWTCVACGCVWKPRMVGGVRLWEPHPVVMILR